MLALILLAGFFELLLPDDAMRKYGRMVIGLIVLFSLVNLAVHVGRDFSLELPVVREEWGQTETAALVAEGLNLRRRGEEQAVALTTPVAQAKVEHFLEKIIGTPGFKVEISSTEEQARKVRVVCPSDPGVGAEYIQRMVAELFAVNPDQVEVEEEVAEQEE